MQRRELVVNLLEKVNVDRAVALRFDLRLGAAGSEVEGFVGADVDEGRRKLLRDLREPVLDERQRAGLAGREHMTVGGFSHVLVEVVLEHVVQMAEGFLLGQDGDVILAGVGDQFLDFGRGQGAAGRRGQGLSG